MAASGEHRSFREISGREVKISNPDKVFFTKRGQTKLDLIDFYEAIEEPLMLAMGGRPTLMQRFPDGASGKSFFQKRVPKGAPKWLDTTVVSTPNGTTSNAHRRHRPGPHRLGRADGLPRVSPVALQGGRTGPHR